MSLTRFTTALTAFLIIFSAAVFAEEAPYRSYSYDRFGNAVPSPSGYLPKRQVFGTDLGIDDFSNPNDLFVDKKRNELYIADTGNNRIVVLDDGFELVRVITEFDSDSAKITMNGPAGIFVCNDDKIYVADRDNGRIIISDYELNVLNIFEKPESEIIDDNTEYRPSRLVVDGYGRIYIQAAGVFQGLICLDSDGQFLNYFGSNRVEMTLKRMVQQIWKRILTREQAAAMQSFVPIEYSNVFIDDEGFIFATAAASETFENQVVRLNPLGNDILRWRKLKWFEKSNFADVHVDDYGFVTAVDTSRGMVYQAEPDKGVMMFAFGGIGNMVGTFTKPMSIEGLGDDLLILDSEKKVITVFELTSFGRAVREAQVLYMDGRYEESIGPWKEVIRRNSNYIYAYVGLGKAYYQMENFKEAMKYFKLGYSKENYSDAFREQSLIVMRSNFGYIFGAVVLITVLIIIGKRWLRKRGKQRTAWEA